MKSKSLFPLVKIAEKNMKIYLYNSSSRHSVSKYHAGVGKYFSHPLALIGVLF